MLKKIKIHDDLVVKYGNPLYIISYTDKNGSGMDYTTSMAEYLQLLVFHNEHSEGYEVLRVVMGEK